MIEHIKKVDSVIPFQLDEEHYNHYNIPSDLSTHVGLVDIEDTETYRDLLEEYRIFIKDHHPEYSKGYLKAIIDTNKHFGAFVRELTDGEYLIGVLDFV